ncbi:MAG: hypothetical protein PHD00_02935 [Bacteroidales bacterium]|nr:hypothetical protein [Bacteroidales bacterium]MDD4672677.1 hypothetical protein [Bacteroidales bacterium]
MMKPKKKKSLRWVFLMNGSVAKWRRVLTYSVPEAVWYGMSGCRGAEKNEP